MHTPRDLKSPAHERECFASGASCFYGETIVQIRLDEQAYEKIGRWISFPRDQPRVGVPLIGEIQYLAPGVEVLSRCERTGQIAYRRIVQVFEQLIQMRAAYCLVYSTAEFGLCSIKVTEDQPIWVQGKGWVLSQDLAPNDVFLTHDGEHAELRESSRWGGRYLQVYDLAVEDFNSYFVGPGGILARGVHRT